MFQSIRIIGIDPGLRFTGWGIIRAEGSRLSYVASGRIATEGGDAVAQRLAALSAGLDAAIAAHTPDEAAVEETFVNTNPRSALKLGQARGVCLLSPAKATLPVAEYAANAVKKAVVGAGHADKTQVAAMVGRLLPKCGVLAADEADALAVAICHASHRHITGRLRA